MVAGGGGPRRRRWCWSDLPEELLSLIFQRISDLSDLHACFGVCASWRNAASSLYGKSLVKTPSIFRLNFYFNKSRVEFGKFLVFGNKIDTDFNNPTEFCLKIPVDLVDKYCRVISCYEGWMLIEYDDNDDNEDDEDDNDCINYCLIMYNPITRVRVKIPPLPGQAFFQYRLVTSTTPSDPNCIIFFHTYLEFSLTSFQGQTLSEHTPVMAFCKPGAKTWLAIKPRDREYDDFAFCKDELYAIGHDGALFSIKLKPSDGDGGQQIVEERILFEDRLAFTRTLEKEEAELLDLPYVRYVYLVEEKYAGELYMVKFLAAYCHRKDEIYVKSFQIFKFKCEERCLKKTSAQWKWKEVHSLEGDDNNQRALLLQEDDSVFVSTLENTEFKSNCIYFFYCGTMQVYDIETRAISRLFHCDSYGSKFINWDCRWFKASSS